MDIIEVGYFEVVLFSHLITAGQRAQTRARAIKDLFPRGLSMIESGQTVVIPRTPTIGLATQLDDRYIVPITIEYYSEIIP
jgi:hypothetical protein